MRIAFLDSWPSDPAEGSGSAAAIAGLAGGLRALGHLVVRPAPPSVPLPLTARRLLYNLSLPDRLRRLRFDRALGFDVDGFLAHGAAGRGYAVALKGVAADEAEFESGVARARLRALARLERRNARRACTVVVTSRYSRRVACRVYGLSGERVRVVPEGVDTEFWNPDPAAASEGDADDAPSIVSVARQYPRKDTPTLLRAFALVRRERPGVRLRVVGGGPGLEHHRGLARRLGLGEEVRFLGTIPEREAVREEYRRADVFCLPSRQEGFGLAFLEAMACGLPVVGAAAGAVPEVVPEGRAGFLVPPVDPRSLANALLRLLGDRGTRRRLGDAGRRHARGYAWPRVARRFLSAVGWAPPAS